MCHISTYHVSFVMVWVKPVATISENSVDHGRVRTCELPWAPMNVACAIPNELTRLAKYNIPPRQRNSSNKWVHDRLLQGSWRCGDSPTGPVTVPTGSDRRTNRWLWCGIRVIYHNWKSSIIVGWAPWQINPEALRTEVRWLKAATRLSHV